MVVFESKNRTMNIAHRGARSLAPENTILAARKALELGADMWELDVRMTYDGELIVIHDDTLERTSNVSDVFPTRRPWLVHQFSIDEIRLLDFGSWFGEKDPFGQVEAGLVPKSDLSSYVGEPAPTLEEALNFTLEHNWRVNLEIKGLRDISGDDQVVKKVIELVDKLSMAGHVLISSFNRKHLEQVRESHSEISTGILVSKRLRKPDELLRQLGAQAYHPRKTAVRPADISLLERQGFQVNVWNVNDQETMKTMIQAGVSGIFTDYPQLLTSVLAE